MHTEAREVLPRVLDAFGFRHGLLVGHSDGGSIAAIFGGSVEDHRVRGLVLIAPHFIVEPVTRASIAEMRHAYETTELREKLTRWHADVDHTVIGWSDVWLKGDFEAWDLTGLLAYIRTPILAVQGRDDQYGTERQIELIRDECYCPVETLMLPGVRHAPHREAPDVLIKVIKEFAAKVL
jgi:pimeloyl-ACP methyl ester carboxylesterase